MKILATITAALLFSFLAFSAPAFSQEGSDRPAQTQDEKDKDKNKDNTNKKEEEPNRNGKAVNHNEGSTKPDEGRRDESRPNEARPNAGESMPEHRDNSRPQETARPDQRQENQANHSREQRPVSEQRGQRIPEDKFRAGFGREHHFHVDRTRVVNQSQPVVVYGGYSFQLVNPWPAEWSYDDDCYIDYVDDGYYMFDAEHPGIRIAVYVME